MKKRAKKAAAKKSISVRAAAKQSVRGAKKASQKPRHEKLPPRKRCEESGGEENVRKENCWEESLRKEGCHQEGGEEDRRETQVRDSSELARATQPALLFAAVCIKPVSLPQRRSAMKIRLISITKRRGSSKQGCMDELTAEYVKRASRYSPVEAGECPD